MAGSVIVVDGKGIPPSRLTFAFTDCAHAVLAYEHFGVLYGRHAKLFSTCTRNGFRAITRHVFALVFTLRVVKAHAAT